MPDQPILVKPIPPLIVNESGALGPLNLNDYIHPADPEEGALHFMAELADGNGLSNPRLQANCLAVCPWVQTQVS